MFLLVFVLASCDSGDWDDFVDSVGGSGDDEKTESTVEESAASDTGEEQTDGQKGAETTTDDTESTDDSSDDSGTTDETAATEETDEDSDTETEDAVTSEKYHHYNPSAFWGKGVAIVLCPFEARMDSCELNNVDMTLHGCQDMNRDVWRLDGRTEISGTIICTKDDKAYKYEVDGSAMHYGECD